MWPVINLIPLIGWNYRIQTRENISTNESTRIYKMVYNPAYKQILQTKETYVYSQTTTISLGVEYVDFLKFS